MSNSYDISFDQGSSLSVVFTLQTVAQTAFNLTGYDVRLQVRRSYGATSPEINCTLANGKVALTDAVNGVITLNLAPSDTSSIKFNDKEDDTLDCVYDLEIQSPGGAVYKPVKGAFVLNREVTR